MRCMSTTLLRLSPVAWPSEGMLVICLLPPGADCEDHVAFAHVASTSSTPVWRAFSATFSNVLEDVPDEELGLGQLVAEVRSGSPSLTAGRPSRGL